jgi:hypothetical protein
MNSAGTHELVHHIRGHHIVGEATPDEQALCSFTHRNLEIETVRHLPEAEHCWRTLSWCCLLIGNTSISRVGLATLACANGSKRTAPELCFSQTHAS